MSVSSKKPKGARWTTWRAEQRQETLRRAQYRCSSPCCERRPVERHHVFYGPHALPEPWNSWWPFAVAVCGPGNASGHHGEAHADPVRREELMWVALSVAAVAINDPLALGEVIDGCSAMQLAPGLVASRLVTRWIAEGRTPRPEKFA